MIAALLAVLATEASAQSRTYYDSAGRVVSRSSTDSQGTVTNNDAEARSSAAKGPRQQTTIYDAGGRNVGRFTTSSQR